MKSKKEGSIIFIKRSVPVIFLCIISSFIKHFDIKLFFLDENQLLYIFSTIAQVTGGMFGLTLTAFVFFSDKLNKYIEDDPDNYDPVESIKRYYYNNLKVIAVLCGLILFQCIIGIATFESKSNIAFWYTYNINQLSMLFIYEVILILYFGVKMLSPDIIRKEIDKLKGKAVKYFKEKESGKKIEGDLREFLKYYNLLENLIITFSQKILGENTENYYQNKKYKPQIIQAVQILMGREIIHKGIAAEIDELRQYRNGLVHGTDLKVSIKACERVKLIYTKLNTAFELYGNVDIGSKQWMDTIHDIYNIYKPN